MNKNIFLSATAALALAAGLTACDENAWNDKLEGFKEKEEQPVEQVEAIQYTLTAADYSTIASNVDNKALAGSELASALASVGSAKAFNEQITAQEYAPAFLASKYYYLNDGSAIQLTYNTVTGLPADVTEAAGAIRYTVSEQNYKEFVWDDEENFIEAFAPSTNPTRIIPRILADEMDPGSDKYVVVTYNQSEQEPVFGNVGGGEETPWEMSSTIGSAVKGSPIECCAVVTAICNQGYMVTDNTGSILVYMGNTFDTSSVAIGQQLTISGTVGTYNTGLQIGSAGIEVEVAGTQEVTYPTPKVVDQAYLEEVAPRTTDQLGIYASITATVKVSGNNVNLIMDPDASIMGSVYQGTPAQKAALTDGAKATVEGYLISVSSKRYVNFVVTKINGTPVAASKGMRKAVAVQVPTTVKNAMYVSDGSSYSLATNFSVLNPADYTAMGQSYANFSSAADARSYLPAYLTTTFPYAKAEDVRNVVYNLYNSTSKETTIAVDSYTYDGSAWVLNNGITEETNQFVKVKGAWIFDPTVHITLAAGRNIPESAAFYQTCVDWVYENICVPMGDTSIKSGKFYVTSYGNNEYYSGTTAYQNNVDLRPSAAREQYAAGYEGMTDDQVVALMKERFLKEVLPGALAKLYPDAKPMDGLDLYYEITFTVYTGTSSVYTARVKVTGPGQFEAESCNW